MAFLLPILVATLATASPLSQFVEQQALPVVPVGWQLKSTAPADHKIDLHIRLKEQNLDQLQQRLLRVSDPDADEYGKHLSKEAVDLLTAPSQESVDSVTQWLASHGIDAGKVNSGYLSISISVNEAKKLFDTDYGVYTHSQSGRQIVRSTKYSLPKALDEHITMVQPTTVFSDLAYRKKATSQRGVSSDFLNAPASCAQGSTTQCLKDNYNVKGYTATNLTRLGIAGYLEEVYSPDDLTRYLKKYNPELPSSIDIPIISVNGGGTSPSGLGEADLDVQITAPLTYPLPNVYYSTGGRPPINPPNATNENEPYLDWLKYIIAEEHPPQTITSSYGEAETSVPTDYADAVCSQFLKLGARGVSVFVSAGDAGAGGRSSCDANGKVTAYHPDFPASCPWVTTVGGTVNYDALEKPDGDGGAGFSNHYATPDYQKDAVAAYIKGLNGKLDGLYNKTGRAYPDISASYEPYPVFHNGIEESSGGTSASSPAVASIFALVNDYLVANNKAPLGFLNPWLYKIGNKGVRDIVSGHNNVCTFKSAFPAAKGWDAASGWGVPDFVKLKEQANLRN